jgi:hypothetical protein
MHVNYYEARWMPELVGMAYTMLIYDVGMEKFHLPRVVSYELGLVHALEAPPGPTPRVSYSPRHQYMISPYRCLHLLAWIFIVNSLEANYLDFAWRLLLAMNQPYLPPGKENSSSLLSFSPGRPIQPNNLQQTSLQPYLRVHI